QWGGGAGAVALLHAGRRDLPRDAADLRGVEGPPGGWAAEDRVPRQAAGGEGRRAGLPRRSPDVPAAGGGRIRGRRPAERRPAGDRPRGGRRRAGTVTRAPPVPPARPVGYSRPGAGNRPPPSGQTPSPGGGRRAPARERSWGARGPPRRRRTPKNIWGGGAPRRAADW